MDLANYYELFVADICNETNRDRRWSPNGEHIVELYSLSSEEFGANVITAKFPEKMTHLELAICRVDAPTSKDKTTPDSKLNQDMRVAYFAGARRLLYCVDAMDEVGYSQTVFNDMVTRLKPLAKSIGFDDNKVWFIPISIARDENILSPTTKMTWYKGPYVQQKMEEFRPTPASEKPLRAVLTALPVTPQKLQYSLTVNTGVLRAGDSLSICPGGQVCTMVKLGPINFNDTNYFPVSQVAPGGTASILVAEAPTSEVRVGSYLCRADDMPLVNGSQLTVLVYVTNADKAILLSTNARCQPSTNPRNPSVSYQLETFHGIVNVDVLEITTIRNVKTWAVVGTKPQSATGVGLYELKLAPKAPLYANTLHEWPEFSKCTFYMTYSARNLMGTGFVTSITK